MHMWLVDEQHVCIRILGTSFKQYRLQPSVIPAPGGLLTFNCGAGMMRSRDDTKPGWRTPDHHLPYPNGLCSSALRELFQPPSLISFFCSPLPPCKNPCLHWEVEMGFVTWAPPSSQEMDFEKWIPRLPGCHHLKINHFPLHQHLPLEKAFIAAGSWNCFHLQFSVTLDGTMGAPVRPGGPGLGVPTACGRLTPWQGLQEFASSCDSSCSPLRGISCLFKCFAGERNRVLGGLTAQAGQSPWCAQPEAPAHHLGSLNHLEFCRNQQRRSEAARLSDKGKSHSSPVWGLLFAFLVAYCFRIVS